MPPLLKLGAYSLTHRLMSVKTHLANKLADDFQCPPLTRLSWSLLFVFFIIYALLAIPFKSYLQPIIVMSIIPFGMIGAAI